MLPTVSNFDAPEPAREAVQWVEIAERMLVCARYLREEIARQTSKWQLSGPEFSMLFSCRRAPREGLSQSELAERLAVSPAQVSGLVEQLRRAGLLEGHRAATDRRRQLWRLSPAGESTLQTILAEVSDRAIQLNVQLGEGDWQALLRLTGELSEKMIAREEVKPVAAAVGERNKCRGAA